LPQKPDHQTCAHFELPAIKFDQSLDVAFSKEVTRKIQLETLPWIVLERINFREMPIIPIVSALHYYPLKKQISAILCYSTIGEADLIIYYGESHDS
jgi:hypothetical protein